MRRLILPGLAAVFAVVAAGWFIGSPVDTAPVPRKKTGENARAPESREPDSGRRHNDASTVAAQNPVAAVYAGIERAWTSLRLGTAEANASILRELRKSLTEEDASTASAAMLDFLRTGRDAVTRLGFRVIAGGTLAEAPSIRVFLLDVLGNIDPTAASTYSRELLDAKGSADEWAVAMRNLARFDPEARPFLASKVGEMLTYDPWIKNPTGGLIEAFDVAVFTGAVQLLPRLGQMSQASGSPIQRAALVALDRLASNSPAAVLAALSQSPELFDDRPFLRADYYGKANLDDPIQRGLVEAHLADSRVAFSEKQKILRALPMDSGFVSANLLTPTPNGTAESDRDKIFRRFADRWMVERRFPELDITIRDIIATQE